MLKTVHKVVLIFTVLSVRVSYVLCPSAVCSVKTVSWLVILIVLSVRLIPGEILIYIHVPFVTYIKYVCTPYEIKFLRILPLALFCCTVRLPLNPFSTSHFLQFGSKSVDVPLKARYLRST